MSSGRIERLLDIEILLDNAACASQCKELLRDANGVETSLREAVRLNVVKPLLEDLDRRRVEDRAAQHDRYL